MYDQSPVINLGFYVRLEFHKHEQFQSTTLQRVISIMHDSHTLWYIPAPTLCNQALVKKDHLEEL